MLFFQESPLLLFTSFLYRCIHQHIYDTETKNILTNFLQYYQRRYSSDTSSFTWDMSKETLQKIAVALIKTALEHCFDSALHQKEFLRCLADANFEKDLIGKQIILISIIRFYILTY